MNEELNKAISELDLIFKSEEKNITMSDLITTIKEAGPESLKKAIATMSDEQKALLREVLTKAKDMTKEAQMSDNKKPQKAREPKTEEWSNDEHGVDAADERLMDDSNKDTKNQGGSHAKVEGWEGQVIKSIAISDERLEDLVTKAMEAYGDESQLSEKLEKKGVSKEKAQGALNKYKAKKSMEKAHVGFKAVEANAKKEGAEDPAAVAAAVGFKKYGKKGMEEKAQAGKKKAEFKKGEEEENIEANLSSEEIEKKPKSKKSEKPTLEDEAAGNHEKVEDSVPENKTDSKFDEKKPKMKKSIIWADSQRLIKANTQGRNATYTVAEEIVRIDQKQYDLKKAGNTFYDDTSEPLNKSQGKADINDLIEQGLDRSEDQLKDESAKVEKSGAYNVSSFSDEEFIKSFPIATADKMRKLTNKPMKTSEQMMHEEAKKMAAKKEKPQAEPSEESKKKVLNPEGSPELEKGDWEEVSENQFHEELEKAAMGEGSKGGKVVGHTKSGKPIYEGSAAHNKFKMQSMADKLDPNLSPEKKAAARALRNSRGIKTPDGEHKRYFKFLNKEGAMAGKEGEKVYGKTHYDKTHSGGLGETKRETYGQPSGNNSISGKSGAGVNVEAATKWSREGKMPQHIIDATRNKAKEMHEKKLQAIKEAPKPNLTKGPEGTEVMEIKMPQPKRDLKVKDTNEEVAKLYKKD